MKLNHILFAAVFSVFMCNASLAAGKTDPNANKTKATQSNSDEHNFLFSPLAVLAGVLMGQFEMKYNDDWTWGPQAAYGSYRAARSGSLTEDLVVKVFSIGVRGDWYNNGVFTDGLYASPGVAYSSASVTTRDSLGSLSASASVISVTGLVGYGWFWDSFNMKLAGGLGVGIGTSKAKVKDSNGTETEVSASSTGGLALEYNLGWTF